MVEVERGTRGNIPGTVVVDVAIGTVQTQGAGLHIDRTEAATGYAGHVGRHGGRRGIHVERAV